MKKEIEEAKRCLSKKRNVCEQCEILSELCRGEQELAAFVLRMMESE